MVMPVHLPHSPRANGASKGHEMLHIDMAERLQPSQVVGDLTDPEDYIRLTRWFEIALNNMARGLSMFDGEQRLIICNKLYSEIFDLPEELTKRGTPFSDIVRYHVLRETGQDDADTLANEQAWIARHVAELEDGKVFSSTRHLRDGRVILVSNQPLPGGGWVDLQEDVTEKRQAEQKINWLARHDPLTELANRLGFGEHLDEMLTGLRDHNGFALYWLDLDRFKEVNDTFGHPTGDALLKSVAKRLSGVVRSTDFVARLGGDEFAILQAEVTDESAMRALAGRIINAISRPHHVLGRSVDVGASVGVVIAPKHGTSAAELLRNADVALYQAKTSGRGRFSMYQPQEGNILPEKRRLEADLSRAIAEHQFELHYQPILEASTNRVGSFEALIRWNHPHHGLVAPSEFINLAEETGTIDEIGAWVLHEACREAATWPENIKVTVNVSPVQFQQGDIVTAVHRALSASGLAPARLEIEITEGTLLRDELATHEALSKLKGCGVSVVLDDFGTAYASLNYLRRFPFDKIKIDRSFIREIAQPSRGDCMAIVKAITGLAHNLNIRTVAEGVETKEQASAAIVFGCDEVQGYYFSKPMTAPDVADFLRNRKSTEGDACGT
jgi:diguanylate cyclase (GGDEF)-like protein